MIRVGIYRAPRATGTNPSGGDAVRGLIRVAVQDVPDDATNPASDAWRLYTRSNPLPDGEYECHILGERFRMEAQTTYRSTPLGKVQ